MGDREEGVREVLHLGPPVFWVERERVASTTEKTERTALKMAAVAAASERNEEVLE